MEETGPRETVVTWIQYAWWYVNADRDDPNVAAIVSTISPGWEPNMDELRLTTERALIGATILAGTVPEYAFNVKPSHFSTPTHAAIWKIMLEHERFDAVLLAGWLADQGGLKPSGAFTLLGSMLDDVPAIDLLDFYADRVIEGAIRAAVEVPE